MGLVGLFAEILKKQLKGMSDNEPNVTSAYMACVARGVGEENAFLTVISVLVPKICRTFIA